MLALTHYSAFDPKCYAIRQTEAMLATITVDGKPVAGKKVYFFLAADKNGNSDTIFLPNAIDPQYLSSFSAMHVSGLGPSDRVNFGEYAAATTNAKGSASFNYISSATSTTSSLFSTRNRMASARTMPLPAEK